MMMMLDYVCVCVQVQSLSSKKKKFRVTYIQFNSKSIQPGINSNSRKQNIESIDWLAMAIITHTQVRMMKKINKPGIMILFCFVLIGKILKKWNQ